MCKYYFLRLSMWPGLQYCLTQTAIRTTLTGIKYWLNTAMFKNRFSTFLLVCWCVICVGLRMDKGVQWNVWQNITGLAGQGPSISESFCQNTKLWKSVINTFLCNSGRLVFLPWRRHLFPMFLNCFLLHQAIVKVSLHN